MRDQHQSGNNMMARDTAVATTVTTMTTTTSSRKRRKAVIVDGHPTQFRMALALWLLLVVAASCDHLMATADQDEDIPHNE